MDGYQDIVGEIWIEYIFRFFLLLFRLLFHLITYSIFDILLVLCVIAFLTDTPFNIRSHDKAPIKLFHTWHLVIG